MLDKQLRNVKDRILRPFATFLGTRIGPNPLSFVGFGLGLVSVLLIGAGHIGWALVFWLLNRIADGLDGTVARLTDSQSDFGGYLDIILDFLVYAAVPIAFAYFLGTYQIWVATSVMVAVFYLNSASWMYLSALEAKRAAAAPTGAEATSAAAAPTAAVAPATQVRDAQTTVAMPAGVIEGTETMVFYTLFFLLPERIVLLYLLLAALTFAGVLQRLVWAYRHTGRNRQRGLHSRSG